MDAPLMLLLSLVVWGLAAQRGRIGRSAGATFVLLYLGYSLGLSQPGIAERLLTWLP
jgi:hypothetical protein